MNALTSAVHMLQIGDHVAIYGLQTTKQYNGKLGTIVVLPKENPVSETSRYGVQIDGGPLSISKAVSIKRSNLMLHEDKAATAGMSDSNKEATFHIGDHVILHGLKTDKYNGKRAAVIATSDPLNEGRYGVRLIDGSKEAFRARPFNMRKEMNRKSTKALKKERDSMEDYLHD